MADIALGVIGLIPVLVQTISSFQTIHNGIKTANRCIEHLDAILMDWKIQRGRFLNECVLLLMLNGEDEHVGRAMVKDAQHICWQESSLGASFSKRLGTSYKMCLEIMKRVDAISKKMKKMLSCFDDVRRNKAKGESCRATYRRIRQSLRFAFDKDELEKQIQLLRDKNADLESIRAQIENFHRHSTSRSLVNYDRSMPPYFFEVQRVCAEAHRALIASFSCSDATHGEHMALIALDVEYGQETRLDMAISYMSSPGSNPSIDPPVKFLLQSKPIELSHQVAIRAPANDQNAEPTKYRTSLLPAEKPRFRASDEAAEPRKKKRKVTFVDLPKPDREPTRASTRKATKMDDPGPTLDLAALSSACEFLRQKCNGDGKAKAKARALSTFFAFLRYSETAQYMFYLSSRNYISSDLMDQQAFTPVPLTEYLDSHFDGAISVVRQYKLALKLTQAVLQFQSTPWFQDKWNIQQLLVMQEADDSTDGLQLYINSKLTGTEPKPSRPEPISGPSLQQTTVLASRAKAPLTEAHLTEAQRRGVDNLTLFCLGVALLEVAHWKPIAILGETYGYDYIDTARFMANGTTMLGKWYAEIIRKCLRCDFAFGTDLKRIELQRAIYGEVICPLEDLIERLDNVNL